MTLAQKMLDERKLGFAEGWEEGREEALKESVSAVKGLLDPGVIAERFRMPLDRVKDILDADPDGRGL